uniref:MSCRAMM family protein n=1 Tax=Dysosmobacter sp. TaxID=2591382 RepID=UPI003AEFA200
YADGSFVPDENGQLSSNGLYYTDREGKITISGVVGSLVVTETSSIPGYTIDEATRTQTVVVHPNDTQTLYVYNEPETTLVLQKFIAGTDNEPLAGVEFLVTDSSGAVVGPNNGVYTTGTDGRVVITGLTPGTTITARETRTVDGFVLDGSPQSILIKEGEVQTLTFWNAREGGVEIVKVNAADKTERLPDAVFEIRKASDDALVDTVTTGDTGTVFAPLAEGDYYALELESPSGFRLDPTRHYFTVRDGEVTQKVIENEAISGILVHKISTADGKGIPGVSFILYDSGHNPIDQQTTDDRGYAWFEDLEGGGRYYLRELENEGYIPDTQLRTVYVKAGETTLVEWENTPITGQIQIVKKSADYNPTNGLPAGTLLEGAVFEIYDKAGNLVDTIKSDTPPSKSHQKKKGRSAYER